MHVKLKLYWLNMINIIYIYIYKFIFIFSFLYRLYNKLNIGRNYLKLLSLDEI